MTHGFRRTLSIGALTCCPAQAADWVFVANSTDLTEKLYVDTSSIRIEAGIRHVWDKLVPARHTMKGNANKPILYEVAKVAFNCSEETVNEQALSVYYEDGTNETVMPEALTQGWKPIPPDTVLRLEMDFVCAWKPK
jgi:hypothetical protein